MTLVRGRNCSRRKRLFVAPSVASFVGFFVTPHDSFLPPESEISEQPDELLGPKSPATTNVSKYFKDNLRQILKAVLEAQTPAPAPGVSELPRKKVKARTLDVYCGKSHIDYYNFC